MAGTDVKAGAVMGLIVLIIVATFPDPSLPDTGVKQTAYGAERLHVKTKSRTSPPDIAAPLLGLLGLPAWTGSYWFITAYGAPLRDVIGRSSTANHQALTRPQAKPPTVLSIVRLVFGA